MCQVVCKQANHSAELFLIILTGTLCSTCVTLGIKSKLCSKYWIKISTDNVFSKPASRKTKSSMQRIIWISSSDPV